MNTSIKDNYVVIATGTRIAVLPEGQSRAQLYNGQQVGVDFVAEFTTDDVDFRILVDNSDSSRTVRLKLEVNGQKWSFRYEKGQSYEPLETLTSGGRKLHFRSQDTEEGKQIVVRAATKHGMKLDEAATVCSQIRFEVAVEAKPFQPRTKRVEPEVAVIGRSMALTAQWVLSRRTVHVIVGERNTVAFLKKKIGEKDGFSPEQLDLFFGGRSLRDDALISDCGLSGDSFLEVKMHVEEEDFMDAADSVPFPGNYTQLGARGVVCQGAKSDQVFGTFGHFDVDPNVVVNPFVVELRLVPRYDAF